MKNSSNTIRPVAWDVYTSISNDGNASYRVSVIDDGAGTYVQIEDTVSLGHVEVNPDDIDVLVEAIRLAQGVALLPPVNNTNTLIKEYIPSPKECPLVLDDHPPVTVPEGETFNAAEAIAEQPAPETFTVTSPVANGHNPDNLTEEQVLVELGWRLLDKDEIKDREHSYRQIEMWMDGDWDDDESSGNCDLYTYRTRLSREELAALP